MANLPELESSRVKNLRVKLKASEEQIKTLQDEIKDIQEDVKEDAKEQANLYDKMDKEQTELRAITHTQRRRIEELDLKLLTSQNNTAKVERRLAAVLDLISVTVLTFGGR